MFFKKYGNLIVGIFFMVLSVAMIIAAQRLPKSKVMDIGPDFMPTVIGVLILVLSTLLLISTIRNFKARVAEIDGMEKENYDYKRVLLSFISVLIYAFVLKTVGFIICTLVYLPIQMYILAPDEKRGKKNIIQFIVIDVIFTLIVYFLFRYGFKILLPAGFLPF